MRDVVTVAATSTEGISAAEIDALMERLPEPERRRASGLHLESRRRSFVLGRVLLRLTVARRTGIRPDDVVLKIEPSGRPVLAAPLNGFLREHLPQRGLRRSRRCESAHRGGRRAAEAVGPVSASRGPGVLSSRVAPDRTPGWPGQGTRLFDCVVAQGGVREGDRPGYRVPDAVGDRGSWRVTGIGRRRRLASQRSRRRPRLRGRRCRAGQRLARRSHSRRARVALGPQRLTEVDRADPVVSRVVDMRESLASVRRQRRYRFRVTAGLAVLAIGAPLIAASTGATSAAGATGLTVTRVSGADRYATAAAIADAGWPNALPANSTLLLATGATFPDAVAGAAAAGHLGVPLLLTTSGALSSSAAAEIDRLKPTHVALLGGTAALSNVVAQQVATHGVTVVRWQGSDRYATAVAVSQATYPSGATNVYLATGTNFPDALAGAALAAVAGGPLLLTDPKTLPSETAAEITRLHPSAIVVLGGTSAVSDQVAAAAVTAAGGAAKSRIQGADRYQTADAVASVLVSVKGGTTAGNGILVATGLDFPDALAGAAWAGQSDRPLLLAPGSYITPQTWSTIQTLAAPSAVVLGGTSAIADGVATGLSSGNPPTAPPAPVVGGATDWPTYHHDAQRTGVTTATPAFTGFSAGWKAALDGAVYGQPLVLGTTVVAATEGGSLYGLSLSTGAVLWRTHIADPIAKSLLPCGDIDPLGITGTPAYDPSDGLVLSVAETAGGHHILAGVSLATGAIAFQRTLDPLSATAIASQQRGAILVANGRVLRRLRRLGRRLRELHRPGRLGRKQRHGGRRLAGQFRRLARVASGRLRGRSKTLTARSSSPRATVRRTPRTTDQTPSPGCRRP